MKTAKEVYNRVTKNLKAYENGDLLGGNPYSPIERYASQQQESEPVSMGEVYIECTEEEILKLERITLYVTDEHKGESVPVKQLSTPPKIIDEGEIEKRLERYDQCVYMAVDGFDAETNESYDHVNLKEDRKIYAKAITKLINGGNE